MTYEIKRLSSIPNFIYPYSPCFSESVCIVSHNFRFRNRNVVFSEVSLLGNELFEGFSLNEPLFADIESKRTLWEAV